MSATIAPATLSHAVEIAPRMRMDDRREIWASNGIGPHRALISSFRLSRAPQTGLWCGRPVCMFGVVPLTVLGEGGIVWMLGTPEVGEHPREFLRMSRAWVDMVSGQYRLLFNYVDDRNVASLSWLKWLGFAIMSPEPYGRAGLPFRRFEMRASNDRHD